MQHVSVRPIPNYRTSALGGRLVGDCASGRSGVLNDKKLSASAGVVNATIPRQVSRRLVNMGQSP